MAVDRRQVKRDIKRLARVKTWQLVLLLILSFYVSATFLRINNVGMLERVKAVEAADKLADEEVIQERLYELQRYVSQHMNTSTRDIYLQTIYERDSRAILKKAEDANRQTHNTIWNKAANECYAEYPGYWQGQIQCILEKQKSFPTSSPITEVQTPDPAEYKHTFLSPVWSPDFAGWSVLVSLLLLLMILVRVLVMVALRLMLRHHYKRV